MSNPVNNPMTTTLFTPTTEARRVAELAPARFGIDLKTLLDRHDMLWRQTLPSDWRYGAPLGNGEFGAVWSGQPQETVFSIGRSDVWDRRNDTQSWLPGQSFAEVREAYRRGDRDAYDRLLAVFARRKPVAMPHQTTCGALRLRFDEGLNPQQLALRVGLRDGTARLTWHDRVVTALVSREYDVLLIQFDRGVGNPQPDPMHDCYDQALPAPHLPWEFSRAPLDDNPPPACRVEGDVFFFEQRFTAGGGYCVAVSFTGCEVEHALLPGRIAGVARPAGRQCAVWLTAGRDAAECARRIARARSAGAAAVTAAHAAWWAEYWRRGLASVGDAAVEKFYYRALYLCGSAVRPGCQSPGLQGVWCGENHPVWFADYHANVNIQTPYWGLFANNRLDLLEPYLRLYTGFAPHAREVAREYYRMRGLKFPHAGSIGGHELTAPSPARLAVEPGATAWIANLFWQYYRYSQDRAFLAEIGYPILRDAALFLSDYLVWDEAGQRYIMPPVLHFETAAGSWDGWADNTLYAQAMFRMGVEQAIAAAEELQTDAALVAEWRDRLAKLAAPPVGTDGGWLPFENRPASYAGHCFMLPLLFPAELVSAWHGPVEWREQARRTWERLRAPDPNAPADEARLRASGSQSLTGNAWCGGQGIAEILRLGERDAAFAAARWPEGAPENGFTVSDGNWMSYIQVDHGPGMSRVLPELLLLETGGLLHLFPGIPANVPARFWSLRAPGGLLVTAEKRGALADYAIIEATVAAPLRLTNPWPAATVTDLATGRVLREAAAPVIELPLAADQRVLIAPVGFPIESLPVADFACAR